MLMAMTTDQLTALSDEDHEHARARIVHDAEAAVRNVRSLPRISRRSRPAMSLSAMLTADHVPSDDDTDQETSEPAGVIAEMAVAT